MHRVELRRRQPRLRVALIVLHLVGHAEFFQQPQNPLRAGVVEMMDGEHGVSSGFLLPAGLTDVFGKGSGLHSDVIARLDRATQYSGVSVIYSRERGVLD